MAAIGPREVSSGISLEQRRSWSWLWNIGSTGILQVECSSAHRKALEWVAPGSLTIELAGVEGLQIAAP